MRLTAHAGFGGRLSGKGPNYRDLAGQPTLQKRPLGIPVIADRAQQQRVRSALEPEWEARLDPKQYGFRPGRGHWRSVMNRGCPDLRVRGCPA